MEMILTWFGTYIVTYLAKRMSLKLGKKISWQAVVVFLSLFAGFLYYLANRLNPNIMEEMTEFVVGGFAISQSFYVFLKKLEPENDWQIW